MRILIIDDERSIRTTLKDILQFEGHVIDVADNGRSGLNLAHERQYDLIILDIKLPDISGIEVLTILKTEGDPTPIIMISGHSDVVTAVRCIQLGAFDFMQKPLDLNRILLSTNRASGAGKRIQSFQIIVMDATNTIIKDKYAEFRNMGLTIIDWAKNVQHLREIMPLHISSEVSSSMKADAVLVNLDKGGVESKRSVLELLNRGVPVFYFSTDPCFCSKSMGDLKEVVEPSFVEFDKLGEVIMANLNEKFSPSALLRVKYPDYYVAAEHLDRDYGWNLVEFSSNVLLRGLKVNEFRTKLDETIIDFFKRNRVAPFFLNPGAVPRLLAQQSFNDKETKLLIRLNDLSQEDFRKEAWVRTALLSIYQFANAGSHSNEVFLFRKSTAESIFRQFMQFVEWLDSIRERYETGEIHFTISSQEKRNEILPIITIEREEEGKYYYCGHMILTGNNLRVGDGVVILPDKERRSHSDSYRIVVGSTRRYIHNK